MARMVDAVKATYRGNGGRPAAKHDDPSRTRLTLFHEARLCGTRKLLAVLS
jgi:hypothetical protein